MNGFSVVSVCSVLFIFEFIIFSSANNCSSLSNLTAETGLARYLTSPNYPDKYPESVNCTWRITSPAGYLVQLIFTDFDTYKGYALSCISNSLNIYDSHSELVNLVGQYCGSTLPADVVSSGRYLYLTFSNTYVARKGFRIEYRAVKKPAEDFTVCSPFNSKSTNNKIDVNSSTSSQYIQSPLYPNKYPSNMVCTWHITASSNTKRIRLTLTYISIGDPFLVCPCVGDLDRLVIHDGINASGSLLKEVACKLFSDSSIYSTVTSTGRHMWVQFKTNTENNFCNKSKAGFQAKYIEFSSAATPVQDKQCFYVPLIIFVSTIGGLIVVGA